MIGTALGHYRVTEKIGAGGMGEVYRATDTKLNRDVALKVLPEELMQDAQRMARFQREAQLLASLNHPNIATIYGVEESGATRALVMELIEGPTLADRIAQGAIPTEEALPIAKQIAEALEYAHEHGVIHRDLKPANIKLTGEGAVKVLDFGLAKAVEREHELKQTANSPTLSVAATQAGFILGTAAYMSPEQAKGRPVDRRADIWAFGIVLFEMLTGKQAFASEDITETLAAVLKDDLNWENLPGGISPKLTELLQRCLRKDARSRLRDIGDARILIDELINSPSAEDAPVALQARRKFGWLTIALAVVAAACAILSGVLWVSRDRAPSAAITRFFVTGPAGKELAFQDVPILALSKDGRQIAFAVDEGDSGNRTLYIRSLDQIDPVRVSGTEGGSDPFFSPDGKWIGFFAAGKLKKILAGGGVAAPIADAPRDRGGAWGPDGTIVFSPDYNTGLMRVPAAGGPSETLTKPDAARGERTHRWPEILPNGKAILFTIGSANNPGNYDDAKIAAYDFQKKEIKILIEGGNMARFLPPHYLLFSRGGTLFGTHFDPDRLVVSGVAAPLLEGVSGDPSSGASYFSIGGEGTLAHMTGGAESNNSLLTLVNRKGEARNLPIPARGYFSPRFSPDGQRIAFTAGTGTFGGRGDIWVYELTRGRLSRLTFGETSLYPVWSPDGKRIAFAFQLAGGGIYAKSSDGAGSQTKLTNLNNEAALPESWGPDGKYLVYLQLGTTTGIFVLQVASPDKPELFEARASGPQFSPDGKWIAYSSAESGAENVYVRSFPASGGKWQISPDGGDYARWSKDGKELFYIKKGQILKVDIETQPSFRAGNPQVLFGGLEGVYSIRTNPLVNYDVSPDGQQFILVRRAAGSTVRKDIFITLDWSAEVRGKIP